MIEQYNDGDDVRKYRLKDVTAGHVGYDVGGTIISLSDCTSHVTGTGADIVSTKDG